MIMGRGRIHSINWIRDTGWMDRINDPVIIVVFSRTVGVRSMTMTRGRAFGYNPLKSSDENHEEETKAKIGDFVVDKEERRWISDPKYGNKYSADKTIGLIPFIGEIDKFIEAFAKKCLKEFAHNEDSLSLCHLIKFKGGVSNVQIFTD